MKRWIYLLAAALSMAMTHHSNADVAHTPAPPYSEQARSTRLQRSGVCQVQFDAAGHATSAKMTKSLGSKILDDNTVAFALKNWTGKPNTTANVPISYVLHGKPSDPAHKPSATTLSEQSSAVCQVTIDAAGQATTVMTKSSGSKVLDDYLWQVAPEYFTGFGLRQFSIATLCYAVQVDTPQGKQKVVVAAPSPAYPYQARATHQQGRGVVTASFDASGKVTNVAMMKSTGSKMLDENTVNYARGLWRSAGGNKAILNVPIIYQLH